MCQVHGENSCCRIFCGWVLHAGHWSTEALSCKMLSTLFLVCQMEWTQCPWGDGENLWRIKGASLHFSDLIVVVAPSLLIAGRHKVFINTKSVADINNFTVNLRMLAIFFLKVQLLEPRLYDNLTCTGEKKWFLILVLSTESLERQSRMLKTERRNEKNLIYFQL